MLVTVETRWLWFRRHPLLSSLCLLDLQKWAWHVFAACLLPPSTPFHAMDEPRQLPCASVCPLSTRVETPCGWQQPLAKSSFSYFFSLAQTADNQAASLSSLFFSGMAAFPCHAPSMTPSTKTYIAVFLHSSGFRRILYSLIFHCIPHRSRRKNSIFSPFTLDVAITLRMPQDAF